MAGKPTYKSFRFQNQLAWQGARRGTSSAPGKPDLTVGSPPEFKGEAGIWCPEEMLIGALNACLMLTFISMAQGKRLEFVSYDSAAEGLLENVDGRYQFTTVEVRPTVVLRSEADIESARAIMDRVEPQCFISNSLKAEVRLTPQFRVAA